MFKCGHGVELNPKEAIRLFQRAAKRANSSSYTELGYCYRDGVGVNQDDVEAERHFRLGAYHGGSYGYYELARCHFYGVRLAYDPEEAVRLLKRALTCRNVGSWPYYLLGEAYVRGDGVE